MKCIRLWNTYIKIALEFKNSTNAEEFILERNAPPAQKWMALFNKILLIWKMWSQFLIKNIRCHPEYPSHGQLISVFSGKVLGSHHGFHIASPFSTSILFLFRAPFFSATISSIAHGCCIGVTTSWNRTVHCGGCYTSLLPSLANLHYELLIVIPQKPSWRCPCICRQSSLEVQRTVLFITTFVLQLLGHPMDEEII